MKSAAETKKTVNLLSGYPVIRLMNLAGKPANQSTSKPKTGQATLEMTAALILLVLLLVGTAKIFFWLNGSLVHRQIQYQNSRVAAADEATWGRSVDIKNPIIGEGEPDESTYPALNIFN